MLIKNRILSSIEFPIFVFSQINAFILKSDQKKLILIVMVQVFLSALDVVGIAFLGLVSTLIVTGIQSKSASSGVNSVLSLLNIDDFTFQMQVGLLSLLAVCVLLIRTLLSVYLIRRIYRFFANKSAELSSNLFLRVLNQNLLKLRENSTQETLYSVTSGVNSLMMGVFANLVNLASDVSILLFLIAALLIVDPLIAASTALMFISIFILINKLVNNRAAYLGHENAKLQVESNLRITEVITSYRELFVQNRLSYYSTKINGSRKKLAFYTAEFTFMPNISKYIVETTVIFGALIIAAIQFTLKDATSAFSTISIFLLAATRLAPAFLRVQQGWMHIRNSIGSANKTIQLAKSLTAEINIKENTKDPDLNYNDFNPAAQILDVSFTYPESSSPTLNQVSISISKGEFVALVGPSGSGKTTLIDVLLGVLEPSKGSVSISNHSPRESIGKWPGAISYVPQDINIFDGDIRTNVALGYSKDFANDHRIWQALKFAELEDVVQELPNGIDTEIGERGVKLSGGQRQRLGIARALFSQPKLLVLDEATSSLDAETELRVSKAIQNLKGKVTVIVIAHRLSTVRKADCVYYLNQGKIHASGTFEDVRKISPEFDKQAKLLGL